MILIKLKNQIIIIVILIKCNKRTRARPVRVTKVVSQSLSSTAATMVSGMYFRMCVAQFLKRMVEHAISEALKVIRLSCGGVFFLVAERSACI